MAIEDASAADLRAHEKEREALERIEMKAEDDAKRAYDKLSERIRFEEEGVAEARRDAAENAKRVLGLKWKNKEVRAAAKEEVAELIKAARIKLDRWKPGKGKKPKLISSFGAMRRRRKVRKRISNRFISEQQAYAEAEVRRRYAVLRRQKIMDEAIEDMIRDDVDESIQKVAKEAVEWQKVTAMRFFRESNHYFTQKIPYHARLARTALDAARLRKANLVRMIEIWARDAEREEEELRAEEESEAERLEKERQEEERLEMERADMECRAFYTTERRACLKERWQMQEEENHMKAVLRSESLAAMKTKYDVVGSRPKEKSRNANRREELKRRVADRQRAAREQKLMAAEDELGHLVRSEEIKAQQLAMLG